jgi:hypothetical protein
MKTFKIGGVHPKDQKLSADKAIDTLALPKQAIIPLSQHIGAPASAIRLICATLDAVSAVAVLVIDCTAIGCAPPIKVVPIFTSVLLRLV